MGIELLERAPAMLADPWTERRTASPDGSVRPSEVTLSVIVPAYREGERIHDNLLRLLSVLDSLQTTYEVVVVSDGNGDATASEARRVGSPCVKVLEYAKNMGKGYALRYGADHCTGSLVTFIDADMEIDPTNIRRFLYFMSGAECDIVVGSKRHPLSEVSYPLFRRFQSALYQLVIRILFNLRIRDTQTGLKLFRWQVLQDVLPLIAVKRFAFDLELLVVAQHLGYRRILEAPIELNYKFESTVDPAAAWRVLWDTAAIFYRLHIKRYYTRLHRELDQPAEVMAEAPA
jgi:glycosyltransferase involved in cell wall biosynthesis